MPHNLDKRELPGAKKLRRLLELSIDEISMVDRPAQEIALATIEKRAPTKPTMTIAELQAGAAELAKKVDALIEKTKQQEVQMHFLKRVDEVQKDLACSRIIAMEKARRMYADEYTAYQAESAELPKQAEPNDETLQKSRRAQESFRDKVDELRRQGYSRTDAMRLARKRHPEEFAAFQAA